MLLGAKGWEVGKCSEHPIFIFLIKENWICAMIRHHAKPNSILLTRNLPFNFDTRQRSYPLIIPLHCLWVK